MSKKLVGALGIAARSFFMKASGVMRDFSQTIGSQYYSAPIVTGLIEAMNAWIEPRGNINAFYDDVWNILTAVGEGLDIWGRILVFPRVVQIPVPAVYLGFGEAQPSANQDSFGFGVWYGGPLVTQNYALPDDQYRLALLAKAATNIWNGSIPGINAILLALFPYRGACYVVDNENMSFAYTFAFALTAPELAIVSTPGILPRPTGVSASVVVL